MPPTKQYAPGTWENPQVFGFTGNSSLENNRRLFPDNQSLNILANSPGVRREEQRDRINDMSRDFLEQFIGGGAGGGAQNALPFNRESMPQRTDTSRLNQIQNYQPKQLQQPERAGMANVPLGPMRRSDPSQFQIPRMPQFGQRNQGAAPQQGRAQWGGPQRGGPQQGIPQQGRAQWGGPQQGMPQRVAPQRVPAMNSSLSGPPALATAERLPRPTRAAQRPRRTQAAAMPARFNPAQMTNSMDMLPPMPERPGGANSFTGGRMDPIMVTIRELMQGRGG